MYFTEVYNAYTGIKTTADEDGNYELHLQKLSQVLEQASPKSARIRLLMEDTFHGQCKWITQDSPTEVIKKFFHTLTVITGKGKINSLVFLLNSNTFSP